MELTIKFSYYLIIFRIVNGIICSLSIFILFNLNNLQPVWNFFDVIFIKSSFSLWSHKSFLNRERLCGKNKLKTFISQIRAHEYLIDLILNALNSKFQVPN